MNKLNISLLLIGYITLSGLKAQNPIIQTSYTADPAPVVFNDTVFLYVGHDENHAPDNGYLMREYRLYTTVDMVNWTDCGAPLKTSAFKWSAGDASAAQCIERDGKYYWYISSQNNTYPGSSIGVAIADSPYGPFKDALGKALITNNMTSYAKHSWDDLDPSVFIDDNGQAYLYWGNGVCYWVKLNKDMVSLDGPINVIDAKNESSFFKGFTEAPWVYKRNDSYYMVYASGFPESIHYSISKTAIGPWKAKGIVMPLEGGSNTNHPGIIDYKGNSYFFYHNDGLPGGHSYNRSVCVEQFEYNSDGTIPQMKMTKEGVAKGVSTLNPYKRTEAETIAFSEGITTGYDDKVGIYVTSIHDKDYIKVRSVNFSNGASKFTANVSSRYKGGKIEIRVGTLDGTLIGTLNVPYTGEWYNWQTHSTDIKNISGIHDIYFIFKGEGQHELYNFNYWLFN